VLYNKDIRVVFWRICIFVCTYDFG
jgi:hypothetical protein